MHERSTEELGLSRYAVMIVWAQPDVGRTPWPTPGNRRITELLSPGVIRSTHAGAVLESNVPARISVGTVLTVGASEAGSDLPSPQARHSSKNQLPVGVIRSTESGRRGIA